MLYNGIGMMVFGAAIALVIDKRDVWLKLSPSTLPSDKPITLSPEINRRKWLYQGIGIIVFGAAIALVIDKRDVWLKLSPSDKPVTAQPSDEPRKLAFTEQIPDGLQLAIVELPGGEFVMGSPDLVLRLFITFSIGTTVRRSHHKFSSG